MICSNCGTNNLEGSKFCLKCGTPLAASNPVNSEPVAPVVEKPVEETVNINIEPPKEFVTPVEPVAPAAPVQPQPVVQPAEPSPKVSSPTLNFIMYILLVITKPFSNFKDNDKKFESPKNSFILAGIVAVVAVIVNLIRTMLNVVRVKTYSFTDGNKTVWQWDNLKKIKYFETIGKDLLLYIGIILCLGVVFYIASLIIKKEIKFTKSIAIASTALIPWIIGAMIVAPLTGLIWSPLSIIFHYSTLVYALFILYELINDEIKLDGNNKLYFNLACFAVLIIASYFVFDGLIVKKQVDNLDSLDNILDIFK